MELDKEEIIICEKDYSMPTFDLKCDEGKKLEITEAYYGKPDGHHSLCSPTGTCSKKFVAVKT